MVTLSKPISASQAQAYHKEEFSNAKENYYTEGERVRGEWQGQRAGRHRGLGGGRGAGRAGGALRASWGGARGAVPAPLRGPAPGDGRAVGPASDGAGVCERT